MYLARVAANVKLTFLTTVLTQIEGSPNSRPLGTLPCKDDGDNALTPLIERSPRSTSRSLFFIQESHFSLSLASLSSSGTAIMGAMVLKISDYPSEVCEMASTLQKSLIWGCSHIARRRYTMATRESQ